jgi:hypothetical protein
MTPEQATQLLELVTNTDNMLQALVAVQALLIGVMLACTISLILGVWLKR